MKRLATTTLVTAACALVASTAAAAPQPLINYFKPMPIVGSMSKTVWGVSAVGSRDPANGIEDNGANGGVGTGQETYYYWDGKILPGNDGKYHMYGSHWLHTLTFGPVGNGGSGGWNNSIPFEATSSAAMGPYVLVGTAEDNVYTKNAEGNEKGHNVTALVQPNGTYTLSVGEIVSGQMFSATDPNGPWTLLGLTQYNYNGHGSSSSGPCGALNSNFTFTVGPDNRFWATSRNGCVMSSDGVNGPYSVGTDSVLDTKLENGDGSHEDEVIWYSGGYFHIVYNYWNVQRAYHIMSKDGLTNWTSTGLAYQGTQSASTANNNWLRYTDGTVNHWHNMERPGVLVENGHVTYFTFAVTDANKNDSPAVNAGGSKIIVVPFNGVQFDCDNGDQASCAEAADGGGGSTGLSGGSGSSGSSSSSGDAGTSGSGGSNGVDASTSGGTSGTQGSSGSAVTGSDVGNSGSAGNTGGSSSGDVGGNSSGSAGDTGGSSGSAASGSSSGSLGSAGTSGSGTSGTVSQSGTASGSVSGNGSNETSSGQSGGGCSAAPAGSSPRFAWMGGALLALTSLRRRRRAVRSSR